MHPRTYEIRLQETGKTKDELHVNFGDVFCFSLMLLETARVPEVKSESECQLPLFFSFRSLIGFTSKPSLEEAPKAWNEK
jgi:hypothetical protein